MLPRNCQATLGIWDIASSLGQEEVIGSDSGENPAGKGREKRLPPLELKGPRPMSLE